MKIKDIFKKIGTVLIGIIIGIFSILFFKQKSTSKIKKDAEIKKEEVTDELEKKSADDIAADSPNPDTISTNIKNEQEEFRKRVRNRLNKNIPGERSSADN